MDYFDLFDNQNPSASHNRRVFLEREHFEVDGDFVQRYRLSPDTVACIEEVLGSTLAHPTTTNHALTTRQQILTAGFFATSGFYHVLRDAHGPSEATVCRAVRRVVNAVNDQLFDEAVRWPANCAHYPQRFAAMHGMPSVCGLIDGTLVPIKKPRQNEAQFVDRKGQHSLNVMLVCGYDHRFVFCNASWPGSVNDARVLRNSGLYHAFQTLSYRPFPGAVLLGDSIYPCNDWLIPPVLGEQQDEATIRFSSSHKKTRSLVERSIGLLKQRFPCLNGLRVKTPEYAAEIVKACVTLHNLCIDVEGPANDEAVQNLLPLPLQMYADEEVDVGAVHDFDLARRQQLINFFA